jgi:hypothetical protein
MMFLGGAAATQVDWSALEAWSTLGSAVVTAITAVLILSQILQTRRSVEATEQTLALTRDDQNDAKRARIDSEMPRLTVTVTQDVFELIDPDERDPNYEVFHPRKYVPGEDHSRFLLPRDGHKRISVSIAIAIANDGPRRAIVWIDRMASGGGRLERIVPADGTPVHVRITRVQTVEEWVRYAKIHLDGPTSEMDTSDFAIAEIIYRYPGDFGAIERHRIVQGGAMLTRTSGITEGWEVGIWGAGQHEYPTMTTVVLPFTREYYASFAENRLLVDESSQQG